MIKSAYTQVNYACIVCADQPWKTETKRVYWTFRVNYINYDGNLVTPTANIISGNYRLNSTISDWYAKYTMMGLKYVYLGTPMIEYEYSFIPLPTFPATNVAQGTQHCL